MEKFFHKYKCNGSYRINTEHLRISIFEIFGLGIIYDPHWAIEITLGFIDITIYLFRL